MAAVGHVEHVIKESILLAPHACAIVTQMIDGICDVQEMLPELAGYVFIRGIFVRKLEGDCQQVEAVHGHPAGSIRLLDESSHRERRTSIEDADVIQSKKSTLEDVSAFG